MLGSKPGVFSLSESRQGRQLTEKNVLRGKWRPGKDNALSAEWRPLPQNKLSISQANCRLAASPNPRSIQLAIAEQTPVVFTIFANVSHIGVSRDSRNANLDCDCYKIGLIIFLSWRVYGIQLRQSKPIKPHHARCRVTESVPGCCPRGT